MPWHPMSMDAQRNEFVTDYLRDVWTMTELCSRYGIARKTGYKWVARYDAEGRGGLQDRPRCPSRSPTAVAAEIVTAIVGLRRQHPSWGPRKLRAVLQRRDAAQLWPARSTVAKILKRAGVVPVSRRRVRPIRPPRQARVVAVAPNHVWTADFKGQFRTGDGRYCYPLTVLDRFSRYALACQGMLEPSGRETRTCFVRLFETYGLPLLLRTDNGTPFASIGLAGLSRLAVWWLRLGITLDRITPAHPEENGSHERFHRTMKAETACPPAANLRAQQQRFDAHRREYNEERPHEALHDQPPATLFTPSPRGLPPRLGPPQYPAYFEVRRVGSNGCVKWRSAWLFLTTALEGEDVGFEPIDDGLWALTLAHHAFARFDERSGTVTATHTSGNAPSTGPLTGEGPVPVA